MTKTRPKTTVAAAALAAALGGLTMVPAVDAAGRDATTMRPAKAKVLAVRGAQPDLGLYRFEFQRDHDQSLHVIVANYGQGAAAASVLRLTVRRIDGVAVGRSLDVTVPALEGRSRTVVRLDAGRILPRSVALADTTFRLDADASDRVSESDETNNRSWHNL